MKFRFRAINPTKEKVKGDHLIGGDFQGHQWSGTFPVVLEVSDPTRHEPWKVVEIERDKSE